MTTTRTTDEVTKEPPGQAARQLLEDELRHAYNQGIYDGAALILGWIRGGSGPQRRPEEYQGELPPRLLSWIARTGAVIEKARADLKASGPKARPPAE